MSFGVQSCWLKKLSYWKVFGWLHWRICNKWKNGSKTNFRHVFVIPRCFEEMLSFNSGIVFIMSIFWKSGYVAIMSIPVGVIWSTEEVTHMFGIPSISNDPSRRLLWKESGCFNHLGIRLISLGEFTLVLVPLHLNKIIINFIIFIKQKSFNFSPKFKNINGSSQSSNSAYFILW